MGSAEWGLGAKLMAVDGLGYGADACACAEQTEPKFPVLGLVEPGVVATDRQEHTASEHDRSVREAIGEMELPGKTTGVGWWADGDSGLSGRFEDIPCAADGGEVGVALQKLCLEPEAFRCGGVVVVHSCEEFVAGVECPEVECRGEVGVGGFQGAESGVFGDERGDSRTIGGREAVEDQKDFEVLNCLGRDGGKGAGESGAGSGYG